MTNNSGQANKATIYFIVGFLVVATVAVIIAGIYSSSSTANNANANFVSTTAPAITSADWAEGNPNAKVTLIEYGDFECPACGAYFPVVQQLYASYSSTVLFVFRNFPLYTIHPDAGISAQAAEAAGRVGGAAKYWAMHDLLYSKQSEWSTTDPTQVLAKYFDGYATSIGLDVNKFNDAVSSTQVLNKIQSDVNGGTVAKIDHTPTFFINLQQIPNPTSYSEFQKALDGALASSTGGVANTSTLTVSTTANGIGVTGIITTTSSPAK